MNDPEAVQIFSQLYTKTREEDELRYNQMKDVVHGTVQQTGTITLDRNYHERMSSRVDIEMSSCNEADQDSSLRIDKSAEISEIEDLKQKMAIGRKQASVHLNSKSPSA